MATQSHCSVKRDATESTTSRSRWEKMQMPMMRVMPVFLTLCACSGTTGSEAAKPKPVYDAMITARRDETEAIAGVEVFQDTRSLGITDETGTLQVVLSGTEGETVALTVKCPADFMSPEGPLLVGLRHLASGSLPPKFDAECKPLVHSLVIGLRAEHGAGLPVVRLGKTVAKTDAWGVIHFIIKAKTNEQIAITLDTSQSRNLRPASPTLTFVVPDRDELVLIEQKFTVRRTVVQVPKREIPRRL